MSTWSADELDALGATGEIAVAPLREDGTERSPTTIWIVRVGDELYVRSYRGDEGGWYRAAQRSGRGVVRAGGAEHEVTFEPASVDEGEVDAAYRAKYGGSPHVDAMTSGATTTTTTRLAPA